MLSCRQDIISEVISVSSIAIAMFIIFICGIFLFNCLYVKFPINGPENAIENIFAPILKIPPNPENDLINIIDIIVITPEFGKPNKIVGIPLAFMSGLLYFILKLTKITILIIESTIKGIILSSSYNVLLIFFIE